jgi:hypothetical protein
MKFADMMVDKIGQPLDSQREMRMPVAKPRRIRQLHASMIGAVHTWPGDESRVFGEFMHIVDFRRCSQGIGD